MALTDILEKIDKEAQARIDEFKKEFDNRKKELEKEAEERQKSSEKHMNANMDADSEKITETAKLEAEMETKNQLLEAKRDILDAVLKKAVEKLSEADNYEDILADMMKNADLEAAQVMPAEGKEEATRQAIQKSGKGYQLASESVKIAGGFILKADKMEIDNSFETLVLEELRPSLEIELHKLLF